MSGKMIAVAAVAWLALGTGSAKAAIRITEWMYQGSQTVEPLEAGEFIELTNVGASSIDLTGWSYDDDSRTPGVVSLDSFDVVQSGESVIITDWAAPLFSAAWGLPASTKVIGLSPASLSRNDEINVYDASDALVDRLAFGDVTYPGTFRTREVSANVPLAALGDNDVFATGASAVGDIYGSYVNSRNETGNPGLYAPFAAVPEPAAAGLMLTALAALGTVRRKPSAA